MCSRPRLPLAVSPTGGPVQLSVQHVAGCSSLVALNRRAAWAPWCSTHLETRTVPSVTLTQALAFIPSRLPIALLKVDAQGVDFALIASTDARLLRRRVARIDMEVRAGDCQPLYMDQPACEQVVQHMNGIGFANATPCPRRSSGTRSAWRFAHCERVLSFRRR